MYNFKLLKYANGITRIVLYDHVIHRGLARAKAKKEKTPFGTWAAEDESYFSRELSAVRKERSKNESMKRAKTMAYNYVMSNTWDYFLTLTFNPELVDSFDYDECVKAMKTFLQYVKRRCPEVKYILVAEQHKSGRFHFHGLFSNINDLPMTDSGHKDKKGRVVFNIDGYKVGFSTATKIADSKAAGNYLTKYITKSLCAVTKGRKRYWHSLNLELPKCEILHICIPDKELFLDTLFYSARYYKECGNEDYRSYLFEYDENVTWSIEEFAPWQITYQDNTLWREAS